MDDFLIDLKLLLIKYDGVILRSASDSSKLVLSCKANDNKFIDIEFDEEINSQSIQHKWYKDVRL